MAEGEREVDAVVVGAGFAGMYMLHQLRELGLHRAVRSRRATAWAAPGTGTATRAPAATSRAWSTRTGSTTSSSRSGSGRSATPRSPRSSVRQPRRRPLRPPRRHPVRHAGDGRHLRRGDQPLAGQHRSRRRRDGPVRDHGHRLPLRRQHPGHPRRRHVRGPDVPHRSLAARGRRLHRPARRRDRHGVVGHPVDPDHRRAGRRAHRVPAHRQLHGAGVEPAPRPRRGEGDQGASTPSSAPPTA